MHRQTKGLTQHMGTIRLETNDTTWAEIGQKQKHMKSAQNIMNESWGKRCILERGN